MLWGGERAFGAASAAFRGSAADNAPRGHVTMSLTFASVYGCPFAQMVRS